MKLCFFKLLQFSFLKAENVFPACVRPNRATSSLLPSAQRKTPHLLLFGPDQQSHHFSEEDANPFPLLTPVHVASLKSQWSSLTFIRAKFGRYMFSLLPFFMEGHFLGMFDKQTSARRNIIPGCLDWNKRNLQVGLLFLHISALFIT